MATVFEFCTILLRAQISNLTASANICSLYSKTFHAIVELIYEEKTKYLLKAMSLFIDQILKWQWKHYIMFEKNQKIYLTIYKKVKNGKK